MIDILSALVLPSNVCFLLAGSGLVLYMNVRTRKAAFIALATAAALLLVFSSGKTATALLSPLEYSHPRVPDRAAPVRAIVVLTAYAADDPEMPLSARPISSGLYRVVEGALLWRGCQDCVVVVTGRSPATNVMAELLTSLGVPPEHVQLDNDAANTSESAANVRRLLGDTPFFLVTSAGHMPRSMAVFAKAGMQPLPAPTDHRLPRTVAQAQWRPSAFHLECSDLAMHERVGMWWYRVRGRI